MATKQTTKPNYKVYIVDKLLRYNEEGVKARKAIPFLTDDEFKA